MASAKKPAPAPESSVDAGTDAGTVAPADAGTAAAILAASRRLFATHTPSTVSLRDVAREAGVNYGLIHRHYGTKENLLAALFQESSQRTAQTFADAPTLADALAIHFSGPPSWGQMLAYALLDGSEPASMALTSSPAFEVLVNRVREARAGAGGPIDPRVVIAFASVLKLGWDLFEPFLTAALPDDDLSAADFADQFVQVRAAIMEWCVTAPLPERV